MKRKFWVIVVGGLVMLAGLPLLTGCGKEGDQASNKTDPNCCATEGEKQNKPSDAKGDEAKTSTGAAGDSAKSDEASAKEKVKIDDVKVGKGQAAAEGDLLLLTYTGKLKDGTMFDSNDSPEGDPFAVVLGQGMVIAGWEQGLIGIKEGGERKLTIPYMLAYGPDGQPPKIPPKADLVFDVKCLFIVKQGKEGEYIKTDLKPGSGPAVKKGDRVTVNYTGKLLNGKKFDSSLDPGRSPFEFTVGNSEVISGWDAGVVGMKKGGVRRLVLPPGIAYGTAGSGSIGPNQVLDFQIELLKINGK